MWILIKTFYLIVHHLPVWAAQMQTWPNNDFFFQLTPQANSASQCREPTPQANSCNDDANIIPPYSDNWDGCNSVKKLSSEELKMAIGALKWHGIVIVHTKKIGTSKDQYKLY